MELVAAVCPVENITDDILRLGRIALRQKMGAFMLPAKVATPGCIALRESEMSDYPEACGAIRGQKQICLGPAVEAHRKSMALQYAVDFRKGRLQPVRVIVIRHGAAITRPVVNQVGRVCKTEVHRPGRKLWQHLKA